MTKGAGHLLTSGNVDAGGRPWVSLLSAFKLGYLCELSWQVSEGYPRQ